MARAEKLEPGWAMYDEWFARPDDVIGGWCIMLVDEPPSGGQPQVADFISEEIARHVVDLHNRWLVSLGQGLRHPIE